MQIVGLELGAESWTGAGMDVTVDDGGDRGDDLSVPSAYGGPHGINIFSGQSIKVVGPTIVYTFAFGVLMYLTLRSIGFIVGAMILHGLTDPTGFLASGGIDKMPGSDGTSSLAAVVGVVTVALTILGIALLPFVRGKVGERRGAEEPATA